MLVLVSGATRTLQESPRDYVGRLIVPKAQNRPEKALWDGCIWAGDNGAFTAFHPDAFVDMLYRFYDWRGTCKFVAAPDVVGNAARTLDKFWRWQYVIGSFGYPVALVAQDGLTVETTPWNYVDAIFIGGTTEFKLGEPARQIAAVASAQGKWVHMGRVNSVRRLAYAESIGCDSVDGTGVSMFPAAVLRRFDRYFGERSA